MGKGSESVQEAIEYDSEEDYRVDGAGNNKLFIDNDVATE